MFYYLTLFGRQSIRVLMDITPNPKFSKLASERSIKKAVAAFKNNGIEVIVADSKEDAKNKVLQLIPKGAEVMTATSKTLDTLGLTEILNSPDYKSVKEILSKMDESQKRQRAMSGAAPEWMVGSIHAATEDGTALIASNSGSQLPGYAYGAGHVVWVVGTQKIVRDQEVAIKRIYEYSYPLEKVRAKKAYGIESNVSKVLIINRENKPQRITLVFVKENLGF